MPGDQGAHFVLSRHRCGVLVGAKNEFSHTTAHSPPVNKVRLAICVVTGFLSSSGEV